MSSFLFNIIIIWVMRHTINVKRVLEIPSQKLWRSDNVDGSAMFWGVRKITTANLLSQQSEDYMKENYWGWTKNLSWSSWNHLEQKAKDRNEWQTRGLVLHSPQQRGWVSELSVYTMLSSRKKLKKNEYYQLEY